MANRSSSRQLRAVAKRDGMCCHYCGIETEFATDNSSANRDNTATREHIVPRSQGGSNMMHNIVLACRKCNNLRGDGPQACDCDFCNMAYELTWNDQFLALMAFNYNKIWKDGPSGRWKVRWDGHLRSFKTFNQAWAYANARIEGYAWTSKA